MESFESRVRDRRTDYVRLLLTKTPENNLLDRSKKNLVGDIRQEGENVRKNPVRQEGKSSWISGTGCITVWVRNSAVDFMRIGLTCGTTPSILLEKDSHVLTSRCCR